MSGTSSHSCGPGRRPTGRAPNEAPERRRLSPMRRLVEQNDDFLRAAVVQQPTRGLVQHVGIEAFRIEQLDPALQRLPLAARTIEFGLRALHLFLQLPPDEQAAGAVDSMVSEVKDRGDSEGRKEHVARANAKFVEQAHAASWPYDLTARETRHAAQY